MEKIFPFRPPTALTTGIAPAFTVRPAPQTTPRRHHTMAHAFLEHKEPAAAAIAIVEVEGLYGGCKSPDQYLFMQIRTIYGCFPLLKKE